MSDQDISANVTNMPHPMPGGILRQAREQMGLTLGEVSGTLKFSTRQIEALENDDFQQLQGKTFLRGFIRAYARLLKLPSDPLLEMLGEESLPSSAQIVVPANMGETDPVPFYRRHAKMLGFAAILLLLSGGIAWFTGPELRLPLPEVVLATGPVFVSPEPARDITPAQDAPHKVALETVESAATLSFEFSGRSWLEVKDASGQILLTGEFPDGQKQVITGKPPYQIWIGRVSAVKVNYGGNDVDLQPHARADVARFTLE
ncbi:MAG: RodZ domain-containing protein [Georgfuchsia sp.]